MTDINSFRQLNELMVKIGKTPGLAAKIAPKVAELMSQLAAKDFDARRSVYGAKSWPNGKDGTQIDLRESGRLRSQAIQYVPVGTKIRATVAAVHYARYQLKHGLLPRSGKIPAAWAEEIDKLVTAELKKHFGVT